MIILLHAARCYKCATINVDVISTDHPLCALAYLTGQLGVTTSLHAVNTSTHDSACKSAAITLRHSHRDHGASHTLPRPSWEHGVGDDAVGPLSAPSKHTHSSSSWRAALANRYPRAL